MFIMRIVLAQMAMSKNIDSNLQKSLDFCDKAKDCDLLFFPEIQLSPNIYLEQDGKFSFFFTLLPDR